MSAMFRVILRKGGKAQAAIRMPLENLPHAGLDDLDRYRIAALNVGETYTDADGDTWRRYE